jgi:hypothetical protein
MFANLRVSVKARQRYLARRGEVLVDIKRKKLTSATLSASVAYTLTHVASTGGTLTKEFEELFEASELGEELIADCDEDTLEEFVTVRRQSACAPHLTCSRASFLVGDACAAQSMPPLVTHQYPVVASVDPEIKDAFQSFGQLKASKHQCISPFLIGACALDDAQLIAEGLGLLAETVMDPADPAVSLEETEGIVEVLGSYRAEVAAVPGFGAPTLIRDAAAALANIARLGEEYTKTVGGSGGVDLFLNWLQASAADEHTVASVCLLLSEIVWDADHLAEFVSKDGISMIKSVLEADGTSPIRLENALQVLVAISQSQNKDTRKAFVSAGMIELLLAVMGGHKTQNSAIVHTRAGLALHHLLANDTEKGAHRKAMVSNGIAECLLSCLMPRVTTAESAETVGALMTELVYTAGEKDPVAASIRGELHRIQFVFAEYPEQAQTLTVYMGVIASLCVSKDYKEAIVEAELIEAVVTAMLEHPESVRLQEQACRTLCEVTRGEDNEEVKDYMADILEDSFHHGFNLIELILDAIKNFVDDLNFVEAACSASWSVAYKNSKMKTKAAEAGVFDILKQVIDYHINEPEVLPHCFGAISNLCANHEPNQLTAATSGIIGECVKCLEMYKDHPMMCVTILNTLKSITVNQDDNMDKYEDQQTSLVGADDAPMSVVDMVKQISETFGGTKDEMDKSIVKLTDFLDKMIETRHDLIEAKKKKADAGKIPMCEFLEEQDHALKALADDEKVKVVKKGMITAQHKGDKFPSLQLCVLTRHQITFYDDPEVSKTLTPMFEYDLPLFSSLTDEAFPMEFETMNKEVASIEAFTENEADTWHSALKEMQPERDAAVQVVDANHKKKLPRTVIWQNDVLYIYMGKPGKMVVRRAFAAQDLSEIEAADKEFKFTEAAHGDVWTCECKSAEDAASWAEFIQEKVAAKLDALAAKDALAGSKAESKEHAEAAALLAKEKKEAEECWIEEEADRRLLQMMANDEALEDDDGMAEFERMETEAAIEEQARKREAELRAQREAEQLAKDEAKQKAKADKKDLRAYIDALKKELAETNQELDTLRETNAPLHKQVDEEKKARMDTEQDYIDMKKEFDKLLGGRLGAVLDGFDFEAMERNKAESQAFMADESEAAKSAAMHDAARAGARSGLDTLDALRAQHL